MSNPNKHPIRNTLITTSLLGGLAAGAVGAVEGLKGTPDVQGTPAAVSYNPDKISADQLPASIKADTSALQAATQKQEMVQVSLQKTFNATTARIVSMYENPSKKDYIYNKSFNTAENTYSISIRPNTDYVALPGTTVDFAMSKDGHADLNHPLSITESGSTSDGSYLGTTIKYNDGHFRLVESSRPDTDSEFKTSVDTDAQLQEATDLDRLQSRVDIALIAFSGNV